MIGRSWRCCERIKECVWGDGAKIAEAKPICWMSVDVVNECRKLVENRTA